jgi:hypothetical protein
VEIVIEGFDAAGQLLTIKYSAFIRYMINVVNYALYNTINLCVCIWTCCGSQWPQCLRRGSAAAHLLRLWVEILLGAGCLSVVSVVCHQLVFAMSRSLVQWSPTFFGMFGYESNTLESVSLKLSYQY